MPGNMVKETVGNIHGCAKLISFICLAHERNLIKKIEHTGLRPKVEIITSITIRFIEMLSAYLTASQKGQSQLTDV